MSTHACIVTYPLKNKQGQNICTLKVHFKGGREGNLPPQNFGNQCKFISVPPPQFLHIKISFSFKKTKKKMLPLLNYLDSVLDAISYCTQQDIFEDINFIILMYFIDTSKIVAYSHGMIAEPQNSIYEIFH